MKPRRFVSRLLGLLRRKAGFYHRRSFAQYGEDMIARTVFDAIGVSRPSYLDVGAHHAQYLSNTYSCYEAGSSGVLIEPDPELFAKLKAARPRDTHLNVGIGLEPGRLKFFRMSTPTLNTFAEAEAKRYEETGHKIVATVDIDVVTLNSVFERYFPRGVDLLSIDVEGMDYDILRSLDTERFRPALICVETIEYGTSGVAAKTAGFDELMASRGYLKFADTYVNTLYVDRERWVNR